MGLGPTVQGESRIKELHSDSTRLKVGRNALKSKRIAIVILVWGVFCCSCASTRFLSLSSLNPFRAKKGHYYKVRKGDTLWDVSRKKRVSVKTLAKANHLRDPDRLEVGQRLWIPGDSGTGTSQAKASRTTRSKPLAPKQSTTSKGSGNGPKTVAGGKSSASSRPSAAKANLIWPVKGTFWISSRYGPRGESFHRGIDLAAAEGTPVMAALDGVVSYAGSQRDRLGKILGFGNYIYVSHDNGLITIYAHNRRNLVKVGNRVKKGQVIAEVGHTGQTRGKNGNHLHFEVRDRFTSKPYNPELFLPSRK